MKRHLFVSLIFAAFVGCKEQPTASSDLLPSDRWTNTNAPMSGYVRCLLAKGSVVLAGNGNGSLRSSNNGNTWAPIKSSYLDVQPTRTFIAHDGYMFVGTIGSGVFRSSDAGTTWLDANIGLTDDHIVALTAIDSIILAGGNSGVFRSSDNGASWNPSGSGLSNDMFTVVCCLASNDRSVFVGTGSPPYVYKSTDKGLSWFSSSVGLSDSRFIRSLAAYGSNIFALTGDSAYVSTDDGNIWHALDIPQNHWGVNAIAVDSGQIILGTGSGVYISMGIGFPWTKVNAGLADTSVYTLYRGESILFLGTTKGGIWRRPLSGIFGQ